MNKATIENYSVHTYIRKALANDPTNEALINLVKSIAYCGFKAEVYSTA